MMRWALATILVLGLTLSGAVAEEDTCKWVTLDEGPFQIDGLPYHTQCDGKLYRFPLSAKETIPKGVWSLAECPSGGRIRFQSDTTSLSIKVAYPTLPAMRNMHKFGQGGIDAYVDGQYIGSIAPRSEIKFESTFFKNAEKRMREITLYLSLYIAVDVEAIGIDSDAKILASEAEYAVKDPIVYYGTSITQGGCASRAGMSYQAILGRRMNVDFVNFGFSGAGKGEPEVAELVSAVTASCFVMDMAQNNPSAEDLEKVYLPFLETIRKHHPDTPILCTTPIYQVTELPGSNREAVLPKMREVIRDAVRKRHAAGDKNIYIAEGYTLLGPDRGSGLVDGVHPNDLGFFWIANSLEPQLRAILGIY